MAALALTGCQLLMDDIAAPDPRADGGLGAGGPDADAARAEDAAGIDAADAAEEEDAARAPDAEAVDAEAEAAADSASPAADAASPDADPAGCDGAGSRVFFRDRDRDGYGDPSDFMIACKAPGGHVATGDDCHDDNALVNPGQQSFFGEGYELAGSGLISFDYDCDGAEVGGPDQDLANPQGCEGLVPCSGAGYVEAEPRGVPRANNHCGSTAILTCGIGVLICTGTPSTTTDPYLCR